jgi:hypothetical protein
VEGRITAEEIQQRMQYSSMCWTLQLIYGKTEPKGEFRERFEKILAELKQPDSSAHMSVADAEALDERYAPRTLTPKLVSSNGAALGSTGKEELKKLIVVHVKAMLPLMELAASDSFTPEDREQIRTEVGAFPFFEFTNALIQLSGERARGQNISSSNSKRRS